MIWQGPVSAGSHWGIVRDVLGEFLGVSWAALRFERTAFGKPFLCDYPEVDFSYSHSHGYLVIGVSREAQIGVDVDCIDRQLTSHDRIVSRFFSAKEQTFFIDRVAFFRMWTAKEAIVKALGRGIAYGLDRFDVTPEGALIGFQDPEESVSRWSVSPLELPAGYCGSVASRQR